MASQFHTVDIIKQATWLNQHNLSDQSTQQQDYFLVLHPPSYNHRCRHRRHISHPTCTHLPLTTATIRRTTTSWATSSPETSNTAHRTLTMPRPVHGTVVTLALVLPLDMRSRPVADGGRIWRHQAEEGAVVVVGTCHCNIWILHRTIGFKMGSEHIFERDCK